VETTESPFPGHPRGTIGRPSWRAEREHWSSGPWTFESDDEGIADLCFRGDQILRAVRAVIRDPDWTSCRLVVDTISSTATTVDLALHCDDRGAAVHGSLRVEADGEVLSATLDLLADADFMTNRIGLVVLHPASVSGSAIEVTHSDGSVTASTFPGSISPHQPAFDIAAIGWATKRHRAQLRLSGDVFEMEDQRNWTDASFKCYNRPLSLPFPYLVTAGSHLRQSVEVTVKPCTRAKKPGGDKMTLTLDGEFPAIGVGASTAPGPAPVTIDPIGSTLLVELDLATPNWRAALDRAAATGLPLDVRIVLADDRPKAIGDVAGALAGLALVRVTAFWATGPSRHVSDRAAITALREALARAHVSAEIVGGARSHFTELNREHHRLPDNLDGMVFALTPLFHELGTEQLVESVAMQRIVGRQAVEQAAGKPVHVGPITLRPRYNDCARTPQRCAATNSLDDGYGAELFCADDARQRMPQFAAWAVASAAALAVPGVASLTYFEDWGPRGIRDRDGTNYPVAASLRQLSRLGGRRLLSGDSVDGLVWALGAVERGRETLLVSNLDRRVRSVTITTLSGQFTVTVAGESWLQLG
jgi:D-apionolactonase